MVEAMNDSMNVTTPKIFCFLLCPLMCEQSNMQPKVVLRTMNSESFSVASNRSMDSQNHDFDQNPVDDIPSRWSHQSVEIDFVFVC